MSVSLYAVGSAKIEVGKYKGTLVGSAKIEVGKYKGTLEQAVEHFLGVAKENGCLPTKTPKIIDGNCVEIKFPFGEGDELEDLLASVADVEDLHGDAPDLYILEDNEAQTEFYVRTGSYND